MLKKLGLALLLAFLGPPTVSCSPSAADRVEEHLGKVGRILIVADIDPRSLHQQWFENVELVKLVEKDGQKHLLIRFRGLEPSPASDGNPIQVPLAIEAIVEIEIDNRRVYRRD